MDTALVLTGAPGSGKSSVLQALSTLLELEGVPHGAIETEHLGWGLPALSMQICVEQLACVLALQRDAGRSRFLIAATAEDAGELRAVVEAVGAERSLVVLLSADQEVLAARLQEREPELWPGKRALIAHARELAGRLPRIDGVDVIIGTEGREASGVAGEVRAAMAGAGLLAPTQ